MFQSLYPIEPNQLLVGLLDRKIRLDITFLSPLFYILLIVLWHLHPHLPHMIWVIASLPPPLSLLITNYNLYGFNIHATTIQIFPNTCTATNIVYVIISSSWRAYFLVWTVAKLSKRIRIHILFVLRSCFLVSSTFVVSSLNLNVFIKDLAIFLKCRIVLDFLNVILFLNHWSQSYLKVYALGSLAL
jgi:hypothetical protein